MIEQRNILYILIFLLLISAGSALLSRHTRHDPLEINLTQRLKAPDTVYLFGTDELGRDLFSRTIRGFSTTVTISCLAFITSFVIGIMLGAIAGYYQGSFIDKVFQWVVTVIFSIPFLLIIAAVLSITEKNLVNAYIVLSGLMWVGSARIMRTGIIRTSSALFVTSERAMGKSPMNILFRTMIPMNVQPAFIFAFGYFPEIVGLEAGLSFLGLGVQPPNPGLGKMIFDSLNYMTVAWWYPLFPAIALFFIVVVSNLLYRKIAKPKSESLLAV